ncbi:MAG: hypothetical protein GX494_08945 [Clostridiaceae bacterium]|nr:hypothetical protein [Clostridiaceae bacterium]
MRRNLFWAILTPCILACILIVLIILDSRDSSKDNGKGTYAEPTGIAESTLSPSPSGTPDSTPDSTPESTGTPTSVPTPVPTPTVKPTITAKPTATPTPTPEVKKEEPSDQISPPPETYKVFQSQEGNDYNLVCDSDTHYFLIIDKKDNSIRNTNFKYSSKYEQTEYAPNPILCYKNGYFVFAAQNQIVISDGKTETVLKTFDEGDVYINRLLESENRILAGVELNDLAVIDLTSKKVDIYKGHYRSEFIAFTDDYLCFSKRNRIPAGPYYNYLYSGKEGNAMLLGVIGEIDEHVLDKYTVYIKSGERLFELNLATNELIAPFQPAREFSLYFPVYGDSVIYGLSDMRFINYNESDDTVQAIILPDSLVAECYYNTYYNMALYSIYAKDEEIKKSLPPAGLIGRFGLIDVSVFPLDQSKFPVHSSVKEKLYTGVTSVGEGEIFLLEKYEDYNNESVPFEMIYAWVPIVGETRAYQLYIYVPYGEEKTAYVDLVKQLLGIN